MLLALRRLCEGCYHGISIVLAFSCWLTKRYLKTVFFSETKEKNRRVQKYPDTEHLVRMLNECPSSKFTLVLWPITGSRRPQNTYNVEIYLKNQPTEVQSLGWLELGFSIDDCHVFLAGYLSYIQHSHSCLRRHLVTWSIDSKHSLTTPPLPMVYPRFIIHFARLILPLFVDDRLTFAGLPRMRSKQSFTETLASNNTLRS